MTELLIRPFQPNDFKAWLPLWSEYHETDPQRAENAETVFNYLIDPNTSCEGLLAIQGDTAVGIAHFVFHPSTYMNTKNVAYLEDLSVSKLHRGQGIGTKLIDTGIQRAKEAGFARFFWMTTPDNQKAKTLYNKYTQPEPWLRYAIEL